MHRFHLILILLFSFLSACSAEPVPEPDPIYPGNGDEDVFDPSYASVIWSGEKQIYWNKEYVDIPAEKFLDIKAGDRIDVFVSSVQMVAIGGLRQGNWATLSDFGSDRSITGMSFSLDITSAMAGELARDGMIITGEGFTLRSVEITHSAMMPNVEATADTDRIRAFGKDETPSAAVHLRNNEAVAVKIPVRAIVRTDDYREFFSYLDSITIPSRSEYLHVINIPIETPGFYHISLAADHREIADYNIGYDFTGIASPADAPANFTEFWDVALEELAAVPIDATLTLMPGQSDSNRNVYLLEMKSIADGSANSPVTIRGYYAEPVTPGIYPALITYQGYDSNPSSPVYCPHGSTNPGYVELVLSTRGQLINNRPPYVNPYGDWFVSGLQAPESYYYRGAYMDAVRAIDFIKSRPVVNPDLIFAQGISQGGALTLAAAALAPGRLAAIAPAIPFMGDFPDYFKIGDWPTLNVRAFRQSSSLTDEDILATLSYFDTKNLAPLITCPVLMTFSLQDNVCPPHTNVAPYNLITSPKSVTVNNDLKHSVPGYWTADYLSFFKSFIDGHKPSGSGTPAISGESSGQLEVHTLSGHKIYSGRAELMPALAPGMYIIVQNGQTRKIKVEAQPGRH